MRTMLCLLLFVCCAAQTPAAADLFAPAVRAEHVDFEATGCWVDGEAGPSDRAVIERALGLIPITHNTEHWWRHWTAGNMGGSRAGPEALTAHYRIAFTQPMTIGSILCTNQRVAILKADAPYPGDPANPDHWERIPLPAMQNQWRLVALPPGTTTRAVLLTDVTRGRSVAMPVRFYARRLHSISHLGSARALTEYDAPTAFGDRSWRAADVIRGRGAWFSNGKNRDGQVVGPFTSDLQPTWFAISWEEPQRIDGLISTDNFSALKLQRFTGPETIDPLIGTDAEWRRLRDHEIARVQTMPRTDYGRWVSFAEPLELRGLRLLIEGTRDRQGAETQIAELDNLLIVRDLQDEPTPVVLPLEAPKPPIAISYELPEAALVTIAIDNAAGQRVRNLIARTAREAGSNAEPWDLKDDNGQQVPPGEYTWKAIYNQPLQLRYQTSVYPNVSVHHPENTAWMNGHSGPGGWLADHSSPFGAGTTGDYLIFTAPVPESGTGFAVTDLTGRKLWGIHSFSAWSGGRRVAGDGNTVYVEQFGFYQDDAGTDRVWAVDLETQRVRDVLSVKSDASRKRGVSGMAARDGKVYLAVNAEAQWLSNATGEAAIDIERSVPFYRPPRKPNRPYEIVPDPRNDFLRLFRLKSNPPGYAPTHGLTYLESTLGPDRRQWIVLAFNRPVNIGSCVFPVPQGAPYRVKLSVLKADAPYPPDPAKREHWEDFTQQATLPWDIAVAPEQCATRALMITFYTGEDDAMADLLGDDLGGGGTAWQGRLEGMQLLRRRYRNHAGSATVEVTSGAVDREGVWVAERSTPLSEADPEIFMMRWDAPRTLRGLAIKELDAKRGEIDVWTGPEGASIDLRGDQHWQHVGTHVPQRRMQHPGFAGHNADARYMNGEIDFGSSFETRAVRIRVVEQWVTNTREGSCAKDGLGLDPTRCRLFGVAALEYIGGETPVDARQTERIEVVDGQSGKIEQEFALPAPGDLEVGPDGQLYVLSQGQVVRFDPTNGQHTPITTDLVKAQSLGIDGQGQLYVFDGAPERRNIRVYTAAGDFLRTIGEPGGYQVGPWNPNRMQSISAIAVDREGKLWATDNSYWPKRVSCWDAATGEFQREYLGPTAYGSGGVLDPGDRSRLFYGPLEFEIDWASGNSRLKNLTWPSGDGHAAGEVPIYLNDRTYMVTRPSGSQVDTPVGIVYLYEQDRLRRVAAMGHADAFSPLRADRFTEALGGRLLTRLQFLWVDRNGDGEVQVDEVTFSNERLPMLTPFNRDLGVQAGKHRYVVTGFDANGVPAYERREVITMAGVGPTAVHRLDNGLFWVRGNGYPDRWIDAQGKVVYSYPNEGAGVGPDRSCGPYTPDQVVCQFTQVGHQTAAGGDLGEFFVVNANLGSWNIWTADGLLAGRIFKDLRDRDRIPWTMLENDRDMDLSNITAGQEHFQGWFGYNPADRTYYAVAGHNHASVVAVDGIDNFRRLSDTLTVSSEDVRITQEWESKAARHAARETINVLHAVPAPGAIIPDGNLNDWRGVPAVPLVSGDDAATFRMAYNDQNLLLAWEVRRRGPFRNSGNQWDQLFKTGATVEFQFGTDPLADPARRAPVEGDKRLLIANTRDGYVAVLYDAVIPGTPADQVWVAKSPVTSVEFDRVHRLESASIGHSGNEQGYVVEAAIPLAALGLTIEPNLRLKMDWGFLETGSDASTVLARTYWANKATSVLADVPSEARLQPDLWGYVIFGAERKGTIPLAPALPDNVLRPATDLDFSLDED